MSSENEMLLLAETLGQRLLQRGWSIVTAESCTGGWLAKVITDIPGSSAWLERGFVTYSNESKQELLDVAPEILIQHGAVSEATVIQMAQGALARSRAQVAVAVSGIAGPGGGLPNKPVGTVWLAWCIPGQAPRTRCELFAGDRDAVRYQTVQLALTMLISDL